MSLFLDITLAVFFFMDMSLTHRYVMAYKNMYPKNDWTLAEANPLLRWSFKKWGLNQGIIFGGGIIFIILLVIMIVASDNFQSFLIGIYFMANVFHFVNWSALKRLIIKKKSERRLNKNG